VRAHCNLRYLHTTSSTHIGWIYELMNPSQFDFLASFAPSKSDNMQPLVLLVAVFPSAPRLCSRFFLSSTFHFRLHFIILPEVSEEINQSARSSLRECTSSRLRVVRDDEPASSPSIRNEVMTFAKMESKHPSMFQHHTQSARVAPNFGSSTIRPMLRIYEAIREITHIPAYISLV
jgi:hypothetical protein